MANQFTLPAGTYEIEGSAPSFFSSSSIAAIYNVTDATYAYYGPVGGTIVASGTSNNASSPSLVSTVITIAAQKTFELRQRSLATRGGDGLGAPMGIAGVVEKYSFLKITKLA